ncbi:TrmO family methyltransferase [Nonomuraea thailandensis]
MIRPEAARPTVRKRSSGDTEDHHGADHRRGRGNGRRRADGSVRRRLEHRGGAHPPRRHPLRARQRRRAGRVLASGGAVPVPSGGSVRGAHLRPPSPGNPDWPEVGIFAQRGKNRPNRLGVSRCRLLAVEGLDLRVRGLDAIDGTPVLDVKPYMAEFGPQGETVQPAWATELMRAYY